MIDADLPWSLAANAWGIDLGRYGRLEAGARWPPGGRVVISREIPTVKGYCRDGLFAFGAEIW